MDLAREVCSAAASVRKAHRLRTRLPLRTLTVATARADRLEPFVGLIADEVNVKEVSLTDDVATVADEVLQVVPSVLGPRVGPDVQRIIRAVKAGDWRRDDGAVLVAGRRLADDEYTLRLVPRSGEASAALGGDRGVVVLDVDVTADLEAEGMVRDVVRRVNEIRREGGLHVSDRIHLVVDPGHHHDLAEALETHRGFVTDETLATDFVIGGRISDPYRAELADGRAYHVGLHMVGRREHPDPGSRSS
jgi:isoleucyl-tRNA synthetase